MNAARINAVADEVAASMLAVDFGGMSDVAAAQIGVRELALRLCLYAEPPRRAWGVSSVGNLAGRPVNDP